VTYEPDAPFTSTPLGGPCAGVAQTVEANFRNGVDLVTSGMLPPGAGIGVQVIGFQPSPTPITLPFPPGCLLRTDVVLTHVLLASPTGTARTALDLTSPGLRPIAFNAQAAWLDAVAYTATTSNALRIVCP